MTYNTTSLQHSAIPEDTEEQRVVKVSSPAGDQSDQSILYARGSVCHGAAEVEHHGSTIGRDANSKNVCSC